jgi:hypothetical protein
MTESVNGLPLVPSEARNRLEVGCQPAGQPHQLDIALRFSLESRARLWSETSTVRNTARITDSASVRVAPRTSWVSRCAYVSRPPVSVERLSQTAQSQVRIQVVCATSRAATFPFLPELGNFRSP